MKVASEERLLHYKHLKITDNSLLLINSIRNNIAYYILKIILDKIIKVLKYTKITSKIKD